MVKSTEETTNRGYNQMADALKKIGFSNNENCDYRDKTRQEQLDNFINSMKILIRDKQFNIVDEKSADIRKSSSDGINGKLYLYLKPTSVFSKVTEYLKDTKRYFTLNYNEVFTLMMREI